MSLAKSRRGITSLWRLGWLAALPILAGCAYDSAGYGPHADYRYDYGYYDYGYPGYGRPGYGYPRYGYPTYGYSCGWFDDCDDWGFRRYPHRHFVDDEEDDRDDRKGHRRRAGDDDDRDDRKGDRRRSKDDAAKARPRIDPDRHASDLPRRREDRIRRNEDRRDANRRGEEESRPLIWQQRRDSRR